MRTGKFNIGTEVGPSQMEAVLSGINSYLDSKLDKETFRHPNPLNRSRGLFFLPISMETTAQKLSNPQKEGFELFRSLVQSHGMILSSYRAPARVIRGYVDSCLNILCNGSLSELPLKKYIDYVDTCKFLGNFPLSYLLAKRNGDGKRIMSSLATYRDRDYFKLCDIAFKRWAKARLVSTKPFTISLWYSVLKGKSCCDEISPSYALDELVKHQIGVSTENKLLLGQIETFISGIYPLLDQLSIFLGENWASAEFGTAQQKACFEKPVRDGGTLGVVFDCVSTPVETSVDSDFIEMVCPCCDETLGVGEAHNFPPIGEMSCRTCRYTTHAYPDTDGPDPLIFRDRKVKETYTTVHVPGVGTLTPRKSGLVIDPIAAVSTFPSLVRLNVGYYTQDGQVKLGVDGNLSHISTKKVFEESLRLEATDLEILGGLYESRLLATVSCASIVAIKEPIKVRIITKGPGLTNVLATRYQQLLIKALRNQPCFRSLGRRICATDLYDLVQNQMPSDTPGWSSSDFSGASDCSSPELNERMQEILVSRIPEPYRSAIHASNRMYDLFYPGADFLLWARHDGQLAQHEYELLVHSPWTNLNEYARRFFGIQISKPNYAHGMMNSVEQKRGTLMGSLTSFPLLCLYVLGIHVLNLRRCGDNRKLHLIINGVLINGDDRLTVSSVQVEENFDLTCREYGMKLSPGKAYWNQTFANMNSQSYCYRLGKPTDKLFGKGTPSPLYIPYLNMGIYMDKRKTESKNDGKPENATRLVSTIQALLDSCITDKQACVILSSFLGRYKTRLQRECRGRNLFVSHSLGGWGVVPPISWKFEITMAQRKLASKIYHSTPNGWLVKTGPLPSEEPSSESSPFVDKWHNWTKEPPSYNNQFSQFDLKNTPLIGKRKMLQSLRICNTTRPYSNVKGTPYKSSIERINTSERGVEVSEATRTVSSLNQLINGPLSGHVTKMIRGLNKLFGSNPISDDMVADVSPQLTKLEGFILDKYLQQTPGSCFNHPDAPVKDKICLSRQIIAEHSEIVKSVNSPLARMCVNKVVETMTGEEIARGLLINRKTLARV